jgi:hypothetical protein
MFREFVIINGEKLLGPLPSTNSGINRCRLYATVYSSYISKKAPNCRPFLHPQPEHAPCRGDGPTDTLSVTVTI